MPKEFDRKLVLLAQDLEEVLTADGNELGGTVAGDRGRARARTARRARIAREGDQSIALDGKGMRVTAVRKESPFEKYAGIGNPGIGKGRKAILKWMRELRGHDEE